ncbi:hypothetical protein B0T10DRAFT_393579 [Thelonectria olida]|uniref:MARVEL domain-containing protein n=1 Tax=Thelonectria olida TaxID=1576542 RepID=A0A9P9AW32_9HYPO|nr:hypothetical protein B0T10DRAFT_393579 [Thelonectria olida]
MTANSNARLKGKEHIPNYPSGFVVLRILQLVLSVVILAILCYTVYWAAFAGNCLMLFTTLATFVASLWMVIAHTCTPQAYNYWAVLALDIFLVVFWLISFAILAAQTAIYFAAGSSYCDWYSCYDDTLYGAALVYGSIMAAASGLGALEFLFFIISLVIHSIMICRHRRAGLHNTPVCNGTGPQLVPLQNQQPQGRTKRPSGSMKWSSS